MEGEMIMVPKTLFERYKNGYEKYEKYLAYHRKYVKKTYQKKEKQPKNAFTEEEAKWILENAS